MLSSLHQVFIYKIVILLPLCQFSNTILNKLIEKDPYTINIRGMRMKFFELQDDDKQAKKLRLERLPES